MLDVPPPLPKGDAFDEGVLSRGDDGDEVPFLPPSLLPIPPTPLTGECMVGVMASLCMVAIFSKLCKVDNNFWYWT